MRPIEKLYGGRNRAGSGGGDQPAPIVNHQNHAWFESRTGRHMF
jgi:hypothetical protein